MPNLLNTPITVAGTFTGPVFQIRQGPMQAGAPMSLCAQKLFTWGSGGTSVDTFLQCSLDSGNTWADVIHWTQNLLASDLNGRPFVVCINSNTTVALAQTTDGTSASATVTNGLFGHFWRVKYIVVGTYAGLTSLRVDVDCSDMVPAGVGSFN